MVRFLIHSFLRHDTIDRSNAGRIEREREREMYIYVYIYIYMCIYTYTYIHTYTILHIYVKDLKSSHVGASSAEHAARYIVYIFSAYIV